MYRKRVDDNHATMVLALRDAGFTVHDMSRCGYGVPDLIICRAGHCEWLEVKASAKSALTVYERSFFDYCPGGAPILAWTPQLVIAEFERRNQ